MSPACVRGKDINNNAQPRVAISDCKQGWISKAFFTGLGEREMESAGVAWEDMHL